MRFNLVPTVVDKNTSVDQIGTYDYYSIELLSEIKGSAGVYSSSIEEKVDTNSGGRSRIVS